MFGIFEKNLKHRQIFCMFVYSNSLIEILGIATMNYMRTIRICILIILLQCLCVSAFSQESRTEVRVDFRVNSAVIDPNYANNREQLLDIVSVLQRLEQDTTLTLVDVYFCGSASPEGSYQLNHALARGRLSALEQLVRKDIELPDSIIRYDDSYISWNILRQQVLDSDWSNKQEVLDVIDQQPHLVDYPGGRHIDHRIVTLQKMNKGRVWRQLQKLYFERMRNACVIFVVYRENYQAVASVIPSKQMEAFYREFYQGYSDEMIYPENWGADPNPWTRYMHVKTNALGLGAAISNVALEIDLGKHWSFALPVYYSALNYFIPTIKFRTLAAQPEFRYWIREDNQGFFVGAHAGVASYNIAVDGDLRYQDHNGESPAWGGGLGLGYRLPISKNHRWNIEFTIGGGVYKLHYDTFYNIENGKMIGTYEDLYWGLDQVAVNISYRFALNKRKK